MKFNICTLSILALCTISSAVTIPRAAQDSIVERSDRTVSALMERAIQPTPATQATAPLNTATVSTTSTNAPSPTPTGRTPIKDKQLGTVFMYVGIGLGALTLIAMIGGAIAGMRWMAQTSKSNDIHLKKAKETLDNLEKRGRLGRNEGLVPSIHSMPARLSKPLRVDSRF